MDAVEDIKNRLSIEDVVGQYVELKRAGRNWKGLSPFSSERTPSFMVSPEKQIWHDFSSGKGGNMFSFVMEMEGVDFRGALELLARKAGVDLEQYRGKGGSFTKEKERLYEALETAARFYQRQFINSSLAIQYVFKKRQFSKETAFEWRLGYSPESGSELVTFLQKRGFSEKEIKAAGLSAQRYRGLGDMFRGRLMIPLQDPQGRVIGFTARLLADDPNAPKYINTPQTPLYDKSRHVFGLHLAKEAIRKGKQVVLVEGNLDVIQSHQAGVRQVVATAGTALTEFHLKALNRFTDDIRLCFDADAAGLNATERAIPIAEKLEISLSIVSVKNGKDPDELIKSDPQAWLDAIEHKEDVLDWLITRYEHLSDLTTDKGRKDFKKAVLNSLQRIESRGEQERYAGKIAKILNYPSASAILEEMQLMKEGRTEYQPTIHVQKRLPSAEQKKINDTLNVQKKFLSLMLQQKEARYLLEPLTPQMLLEDEAKELLALLKTNPDYTYVSPDEPALLPLAEYAKMLLLLYEELYQDLEVLELRLESARLQGQLIEKYVKTQTERIARELKTAEGDRYRQLIEAGVRLTNLLKTYKGV